MDKEKLQRGLGLFLDAMRPCVVSVVERECRDGVSWDMDFERRMDNERKKYNFQMQRMRLNNNGSSLTGLIDYNNRGDRCLNHSSRHAQVSVPVTKTLMVFRLIELRLTVLEGGALNEEVE